MKRSRHFTLVEMLISLGLTALILSSLTFFFQQINSLNRISERVGKEIFSLRNLENRLGNIIPKAVSPKDPAGDFLFYSSTGMDSLLKAGSPSLVLTFDNGVNLADASFSNHVLGRIFLDKDNNLTFAAWPSISRWDEGKPIPMMREVLFENVEGLSFQFFIPPERTREEKKRGKSISLKGFQKEEPEPKGSWVTDWKYEYSSLPALVKIEIKIKSAEGLVQRTMAFPIVHNGEYIVYEN